MITVLLTTHNSARHIEFSIKSILNQTFGFFELLVIDDGSTDNTEEILAMNQDKRIRYIKIDHIGRSKALNYGLKMCKYDWVALIDADDIAHPKRLEFQFLKDLKRNNVVIISSAFFHNDKISFKIDVTNRKFPQDLILHQKFSNSVLFNKNFILENGGYNEELLLAEDYELWLRIKETTQFIIVNKVLMFCRYSSDSLSRRDIIMTNKKIYDIQEKHYNDLKSNFNVINVNEQNIFRGWREYFYGDPKLARDYWLKNSSLFKHPRAIFALFITFLPLKHIEKFKLSEIILRLRYFYYDLKGKNNETKRSFNKTMKSLSKL